jgi:hypothetical protein
MLNAAILFLVFNQSNAEQRVFESIRQARSDKLYIAGDVSRKDKEWELEKELENREVEAGFDCC